MYADVLIEYNNKTVDKTFTYEIPLSLRNKVKVGMQVQVPFNRKTICGFVVKINDSFVGEYEVKSICNIECENFILNKELLELGKYLKSITLCNLISAYQVMLPSSLKIKKKDHDYNKYQTYLELAVTKDEIIKYLNNCKYSGQVEILNALLKEKNILKNGYNPSSVMTLLNKKHIKEIKKRVYRLDYSNIKVTLPPALTEEQQLAVDKVTFDNYKTYLLYGVTGSGKTEVYMALIDKVLACKKTALFLVPEISLTTQMIERLLKRFTSKVAIFHSGLSNGEKYDEYAKIYNEEVKIVVGTRSAIFTPLKNIGLIILDEEHSETYKQDNMPRYNAIDIAKWRANYNNCPLILGSATPNIEDMAKAQKNVYELLTLNKRVGQSCLPKITLVNMQEEVKYKSNISQLLNMKIKERLNAHEQVMLLLNRRGYSTTVSCSACGFVYKCPHCDITLTYHKTSGTLRCHYCGYTVLKNTLCPKCGENALSYMGLGTEKLEWEIQNLFPEAKILRMDVDTTTKKGAYEKLINDFFEQKYDIMVGTQMISKGLDFPKVTLVGIINADTSLNIPDFRSGERTFQLLSQVAGRAGRSSNNGEVIIQTFNPDNCYMQFVKNNDYMNFYQYEMQFRKNIGYPPYYYLINILVTGKALEEILKESQKIFVYLQNNIDKSTMLYGPNPATMAKVNNIYRYQLIIKYRYDKNLFKSLQYIDNMYVTNRKINVDIDINPVKM